ncbi:MAG: hypothetical protein U0174_06000 [Polyangiaceae bacterium]
MSDELTYCPECRSKSATLPSEKLRFVCAVCGAPRIPAIAGASEPAEVRAALRTSRQQTAASLFGKLFGVTLWFASLVLFGVGAAAWGHAVGFAFLGVGIVALLLGFRSYRRGAKAEQVGKDELARAWELAAAQVVEASPGSVTPKELADKLRVEEPEAEKMLVTLAGGDRVRVSDETDELAFQSTSAPPLKEENR